MPALQGVGSIMGGIIIMQAGAGGVEYIFTEKNFGQFASNEEVKSAFQYLAELILISMFALTKYFIHHCAVLLQIIASCRSAAQQKHK